jgi:DNA-binding response OmpR family regulator
MMSNAGRQTAAAAVGGDQVRVLLDLGLPDSQGLDGLRQLLAILVLGFSSGSGE